MKISFKYRFIISFVFLEILFLAMIAMVNFSSINKASENFIQNKSNTLKTLVSDVLVIPLSIYDLATIDNIIQRLVKEDDSITSIKVYDNQNRVVSKYKKELTQECTLVNLKSDILVDSIKIGRFELELDFHTTHMIIQSNQEYTLTLIAIEILISILLSWLIGHKVAYSLRDLSESANTLLKNIDKSIDKVDGAIELQVLSESMENMRKEIQNDRHELKLYSEIINQNVIISRTDLKGKIVYVSEAFCDISGYSQEELIGKNHNIVRHPDMPKSLYEELWQSIQNDNTWSGEIKNLRKDGDEYWVKATITPWIDKDGKKIGYIGIRQDIGDKKRVEELAITDRLTQIYNRIKLDEVLASEIAKANRYEYSFSTILIDIDHFKSVNDTYGHQVGDSVLKECASLVKSNIRETDIFGRWGGEEFLIICINTDLDSAVIVANKLRESIDSYDFSVVGHKSASFGVSEYLKDDNEESIVKRADDALYRAKESGRNRVEC